MASGGNPQFRYTQPPSKVIHVRNLPWECTDEELAELGSPFGKVVNTKCNVGANRNQAFIEFVDQNQAIAMVSYYASSAEPAQVRGKNVYLQNLPCTLLCFFSSFVIKIRFGGALHSAISWSILFTQVFSAFGYVHKIATFEKASGYQALIQFSDTETASSAKDALDGRCIPSYLLPELDGACTLRINYSAHSVLNVKFQSHRSRDYTNPYLPLAPSAIDGSGLAQDGKNQEAESNVLLASVENMQYIVTIDALHEVFSAYGVVQKIAIFEKNAGFHALIQYPDIQTAVKAKEALEGHSIYEGGYCKLHLAFSRHTDLNVRINNERGRDYTGGNSAPANHEPSILGPQPSGITGNLRAPPGAPAQIPGYGAPGFPQGSNQAQVSQYSGQGNQQMPNHQLSQGSPQGMSFHGHGRQQLPPGLQMMQGPGYGGPQFPQGPMQPMPQFHVYGNQQFPPGAGPQMMAFPGQGGQYPPFGRQLHPYNR
uniref:Uncharacterized protein n=1 Tax=Avena sativa TaxID=4498 RepID=A0ACD5W1N4_AVESA